MIAIVTLLITVTLSLLVTRVAAMALMLTGLSRAAARFQARSAFSGVGYTTNESESVVDHPVRRQIVMTLMLLGNVGIATVVATVMISIVNAQDNEQWLLTLSALGLGLLALWLISKSRWIERRLNKVISWALRRFTRMEIRDYVAVLNLQQGFAVTEMRVEPSDWVADKTLVELNLAKEGVLVLGIQRSQPARYIGAPTAQTKILAYDTLVLYGKIDRIVELDQRRAGRSGDQAHQAGVEQQNELVEQEAEEEAEKEEPEPGGPVSK